MLITPGLSRKNRHRTRLARQGISGPARMNDARRQRQALAATWFLAERLVYGNRRQNRPDTIRRERVCGLLDFGVIDSVAMTNDHSRLLFQSINSKAGTPARQ